MTKKIESLAEFNEEFKNYRTFFFSDEISKGLWAMDELKVVVVSNELFNEFIEEAGSSEIILAKELLESRLRTSKYRKIPVNFIDQAIEKLGKELTVKYLMTIGVDKE